MFDIPAQYCESIAGYFVSQPLNAISSASFLVAAFFAYRYLRERGNTKLHILPILLGIVGIGSTWWHLTDSHLGDLLDTFSIAAFASMATILFLARITKSKTVVVVFFSALLFLVLIAERITLLNGSLPYVVLFIGFVIAGTVYVQKHPSAKALFVTASITFLAAILFRSIDVTICHFLPFGTHFLWHILIAGLGYQIILLLVQSEKSDESLLTRSADS